MNTFQLKNHLIEYVEEEHIYVVDGIIIPSVTQILDIKFKNKYSYVNREVLQKASDRGTLIHKEIQDYCENGKESSLEEVYNFKFLQNIYKFKILKNEVPIIIEKNGNPVAVGRLDLIIEKDNKKIVADIKTTSTLDRQYLMYQLNLYKIGYEQTYGENIQGLKGIHLKESKRNLVDIPIDENCAWNIIDEYYKEDLLNE